MPSSSARLAAHSLEALEARVAPAILFGVTKDHKLISFDSTKPSTILTSAAITGLGGDDSIVGVDFRPSDSTLFAVTIGANATGHLYTLSLAGVATEVNATAFSQMLAGNRFDIDYDPQANLIRLVSNTRQNLRIDPANGTVTGTDTSLTYAAMDPNAGHAPAVSGIAYTNSYGGASSTALFDLDGANGIFSQQDPPAAGTLATKGTLKLGGATVTGFDLPAGSQTGFAGVLAGNVEKLYAVNIVSGGLTFLGNVGTELVSLAALPSGLGLNGKTATYRDVDGDTVTLTTSKGTWTQAELTFSAPNAKGGVALQHLDVTPTKDTFAGAQVSLSAKISPAGGNGFADVGSLNFPIGLASLTVKGDVSLLTLGTGSGLAIGSLKIGSLAVSSDFSGGGTPGATISGDAGSLTISGLLTAGLTAGNVKTLNLGEILSTNVQVASIGTGKLGTLNGATLFSTGDIKSLTVGAITNSTLFSDGVVGSVSVKGSIVGAVLQVRGHLSPESKAAAQTIGSVAISGDATGFTILAGYDSTGAGVNSDVQIGKVSVTGAWTGGGIVAGLAAGADTKLGTSDDVLIAGGNATISTIAKLIIGGNVTSGGQNSVGFEASQFGSVLLGGSKLPLTAGTDTFVLGSDSSFVLREII